MKCRLICTDIDGTLLDDCKRLQTPVRESLLRAAGEGIRIALISGRMPAAVSAVEEEIGTACIKACNAGTYIMMGDACISADYLRQDAVRGVYGAALKYELPLWIFQDRSWLVTDVDRYVRREIETIRQEPQIVDMERLLAQWKKERSSPNKLLLAAEPSRLRAVYRELKAQSGLDIDMAYSADTFLEIFPKGTNKGKAVAVICEKLQIDRKHTIAIGDHELDIPMIEAAGVGVAMGNAISALKEKADFVTKTNNEAGAAWALRHYLAGWEENAQW